MCAMLAGDRTPSDRAPCCPTRSWVGSVAPSAWRERVRRYDAPDVPDHESERRMSGSDQLKRPKGRFSSRVEPFWLNPATIKGTVAIAGGVLILAFPDSTLEVLRLVVGLTLIVVGWLISGSTSGSPTTDSACGSSLNLLSPSVPGWFSWCSPRKLSRRSWSSSASIS